MSSQRAAAMPSNPDSSKIGADEIPESFWDSLKQLFPLHTRLIEKLRHRLVDCRSDSINAGTALMLMTAVSNVAVLKHELYTKLQADLQIQQSLMFKLTEEIHALREILSNQTQQGVKDANLIANEQANTGQIQEINQFMEDLKPDLSRMTQILAFYQQLEAAHIFGSGGNRPNPLGLDYSVIATKTAWILAADKPWWAKPYLFLPIGGWILGGILLLNLLLPIFNFIYQIFN